MILNDTRFLEVVEATPLVAVDLIIKNADGEVLLGKRRNRPAKGFWFVPGGRIRKNERISEAIARVSGSELGIDVQREEATLLGVFEHLYADNFLGIDGVDTHYVVLAFQFDLEDCPPVKPDDQHLEMRWWRMEELLQSPGVHQNTKDHFIKKSFYRGSSRISTS
jgi:colanic acid biosynthesis protein WcaH